MDIMTLHHKMMRSEEELSFSVLSTLKPHIRVAALLEPDGSGSVPAT